MTTAPHQSRRARLREETSREIRSRALALLADGGPPAISLREIARQMGMTAGAIYGYFANRDLLVEAVIDEVFAELAATVEAARDALPTDDAAGRLVAWATAFRDWSIAHPEGFKLIYGDAVPGYRAPEHSVAAAADRRLCTGLAAMTTALALSSRRKRATGSATWSEFDPLLVEDVHELRPDADADLVELSLRAWGRMHGLVSLEIYGHLTSQTNSPGRLYLAEMHALADDLARRPR